MNKFVVALMALCFLSSSAWAQVVTTGVASLETKAKQAIVVEGKTGAALYEKEADTRMPTSSMSKVMTMYLVFDAIKQGKLSLDSNVVVSEKAWKQTGSRTFLAVRSEVRVEDLVRGVIVQSGNDAAVALAEAVAGTEEAFAEMMNAKAAEFGMTNSHFMNATGLPDPEHYSTARDLSKLAVRLMNDFPDFYHYYSEKEFTYNKIKQGNRNPLLYRNMDVDGMKTGHTDDAGYGLIATALRDGRRIVTVVNGLESMQERADAPAALIEWAYREYGLYSLLRAEEKVGQAKIWLGREKAVDIAPSESLAMTLPRSIKDQVKVEVVIEPETQAPITKGQQLGKALISGPGLEAKEVPLVAMQDVQRLGMIKVLWQKFRRQIGLDKS